MRTLLLATFTVAFLCLPAATASAGQLITCEYVSSGSDGFLTISGAAGLDYSITDQSGRVVGAGVVASNNFTTAVVAAAPGPLGVRVGGEYFVAGDRDYGWE